MSVQCSQHANTRIISKTRPSAARAREAVTWLNGGLMLPAVPFPRRGCSAGRTDPACLQEYSGQECCADVGWRTDPENYRWQGNRSRRTAAGMADGRIHRRQSGLDPALILQKAACRVALHIWRLCRPGGGCAFRHEGVRFGWLHRRRGRDQRADRSTRTTLSEAYPLVSASGRLSIGPSASRLPNP